MSRTLRAALTLVALAVTVGLTTPGHSMAAPPKTVDAAVSSVPKVISPVYITTTPWPSRHGSLSGIAASICHDASKWPTIARANGVRNPLTLQPGRRLLVPCADAVSPPPRPTPNAGGVRAWIRPITGGTNTGCWWDWRGSYHHKGSDVSLDAGSPIRAASSGVVQRAGWWSGGYGISVLIDHGNGYLTHYAHMSRTTVNVGQRVNTGQRIGSIGSTGDSSGPHLHFEVWRGMWNQVNPVAYMAARGVRIGC